MMKIDFSPASQQDIPQILEMMESFYAIDHYPFDREKSKENLRMLFSNPQLGILWMIYAGEHLAGYLALTSAFSFEYGGKTAFVDELYLKEAFRHTGIGTRAIDHAIAHARRSGLNALHLEVENHNEKALKLYSERGFRGKNRSFLTKMLQSDTGSGQLP